MNASMTHRLAPQRGELINRAKTFTFAWNGTRFPAYAGDTIVSALAACGVQVFSRSYKYHRPRGILTANYLDPSCMMQVGDEPNVRAAHRLVEPGMKVTAQTGWPSLNFDVKASVGLVARFLGPGFYYKTFMWPRRWWPLYEHLLRRFIAGGTTSPNSEHGYYDKRYAHPDVVIAGGGPAGMAAAIGRRVGRRAGDAGGRGAPSGRSSTVRRRKGVGRARATPRRIAGADGNRSFDQSVVTGRYDGNWIAIVERGLPKIAERLIKARAKVLVVAPGLIERPYVFEGNDLPGVMLSGAVRRLINLYAVRPGTRAVVFTANDDGDLATLDLRRVGIEVAAVADARRGEGIVRALGRNRVRGVELTNGSRIDCDLLVIAAGWTAPTALLNMAGDQPKYETAAARFFPGDNLPGDVFAAGGLAGGGSIEELIAHARAVGAAAAARAGHGTGPAAIAETWRARPSGAFPEPNARNGGLVRRRFLQGYPLRSRGGL